MGHGASFDGGGGWEGRKMMQWRRRWLERWGGRGEPEGGWWWFLVCAQQYPLEGFLSVVCVCACVEGLIELNSTP